MRYSPIHNYEAVGILGSPGFLPVATGGTGHRLSQVAGRPVDDGFLLVFVAVEQRPQSTSQGCQRVARHPTHLSEGQGKESVNTASDQHGNEGDGSEDPNAVEVCAGVAVGLTV